MINELNVLNDCKELFKLIIEITKKYPQFNYNLNNHTIKTTVSIGSNIAESNNRSDKMFYKCLNIAYGELNELSFQIDLYEDLNKNIKQNILSLIDKIRAIIYKLKQSRLRSAER